MEPSTLRALETTAKCGRRLDCANGEQCERPDKMGPKKVVLGYISGIMLPIYVGVIIINHFKDAHSITSIMESRRFFS